MKKDYALFITAALVVASFFTVAVMARAVEEENSNLISCSSSGALIYCKASISSSMSLLESYLDRCSASNFYYSSDKTAALISSIDGDENSPYPDDCFLKSLGALVERGFYAAIARISGDDMSNKIDLVMNS